MVIINLPQKIRLVCMFICLFMAFPALADDEFVIKKIEIQGLQRISAQTTMEYLPVHVGETLTSSNTGAVISALYQTGFFSNVSLARKGDILVIQVSERPTIGSIKISGNKQIKTKDLTAALKQAGIVEGGTYDQAVLDAMKQAMVNEYHKAGRYDATVETVFTQQTRNRMAVDIIINEGIVAKVKQINIVGNHAFTSRQLLKDFTLGKKPWWAFFSNRNQYSEDKLQADLKELHKFYLDRGYLRFQVDSQDVKMTPDKKSVVVTIYITEGALYRIKGYRLGGTLLGQEAIVSKFITLKPQEVFSRKKVMAINDAIGRFYGDQGYAMAQVNAVPTIDDVNHQVFLTFEVTPGQRIYVRNIDYFGNTKTADEVLRRETRQMEGGVYSISQQEETTRRLNNLGYLEGIESKFEPVPGKPNEVDVKYNVKETSSTTATAQVGYSDAYGIIYGANVTQKNFRGSGKTVSLGFNNSQYAQTYSFNYFNPYYTKSGMSRGFSLYFQQVTPDDSHIAAYTLDSYGAMMNYRMPLSEYDYFSFGYGYEYLHVKQGDNSTQINNFISQHGDHFNNIKVTLGWMRNTYDRAILPTKGYNQWLGGEFGLPGLPDSLEYYRINYDASFYQPIAKGFILALNADLGYGNGYGELDGLPFFKNYYAGGMGTVRGYESNTLGPRDSMNNALGGNVLTTANVNLIVPNPFAESHRVRTSLFFDAGNVFANTVDFGEIRYSTGLEIDWVSPMGPLKVSFGQTLNSKPGDSLQFINFSIGASF